MIVGIGTDMTGLDRIKRLLEGKRGDAFLKRALTEEEQEIAKAIQSHRHRYIEFVAGRWAAKEAIAKALGCGIGATVGLQDIAVLPDENGRPVCTLSGKAWERLARRGCNADAAQARIAIHVSITHSNGMAAAFAVAERLGE
jgi:holo-[acyl-carrier protein] synthase